MIVYEAVFCVFSPSTNHLAGGVPLPYLRKGVGVNYSTAMKNLSELTTLPPAIF